MKSRGKGRGYFRASSVINFEAMRMDLVGEVVVGFEMSRGVAMLNCGAKDGGIDGVHKGRATIQLEVPGAAMSGMRSGQPK